MFRIINATNFTPKTILTFVLFWTLLMQVNASNDSQSLEVSQAPEEVRSLKSSTSLDNTISLEWISDKTNTAGYKISFQEGAVPPSNCHSGTQVDAGPNTKFEISKTKPKTQYSFRVCSYNDSYPSPEFSKGAITTARTLTYKFKGETPDDQFGQAISSAGDFNGDGKDDIIIGAYKFNGKGGSQTGKVYIYSGLDQSLLFAKEGENKDDHFGKSVSTAGDFNQDGRDDVIIGAPNFDCAKGINCGKVYIYSGIDGNLLFSKEGQKNDEYFGNTVSYAGDFNGDGKKDIIIGAFSYDKHKNKKVGLTYVFLNPTTFNTTSRELAFFVKKEPPLLNGQLVFSKEGEKKDDYFGRSVSFLKDFNSDGKADLIVGADNHSGNERKHSGKVYIYSSAGNSNPLIFTKEGEDTDNFLGTTVNNAGDVNGDNIDDIIISAYRYDGKAGKNSGKIYVLSGKNASILFTKEGEHENDMFGISTSGIGDFNGDGKDDVAVGTWFYNGNAGKNSGKVYVYSGADAALLFSKEGEKAGDMFGHSISDQIDLDNDGKKDLVVGAYRHDGIAGPDSGKVYAYSSDQGKLLFSLEGKSAGDFFGYNIATINDLNRDMINELVIGAHKHTSYKGKNTGKAYIFSGRDQSILFESEGESAGDNYGKSLASAGDFNGDGLEDIIVGAYGYDGATGIDVGKIYVYSGKTQELLFSQEGERAKDHFGSSVSKVGDFNGDGRNDIIVGAFHYDGKKGKNSGKVYVYSIK